jgi:hypothetical protein
LTRLG